MSWSWVSAARTCSACHPTSRRHTPSSWAARSVSWPSGSAPRPRSTTPGRCRRSATGRDCSSSDWARTSPTPEALRRAAGSGVRSALSQVETGSISVAVSFGTAEPETTSAVAEGALLGSYRFAAVGSDGSAASVASVAVIVPPQSDTRGPARRWASSSGGPEVVAGAVVQAREWVNLPPNLLYPDSFAEEVRTLLKDAKVTVDVLDEKALSPRRLRRHPGGRVGVLPATAAGPAQLCPARRPSPSRAGRQGHHVRLRRSQPQAQPTACTP